MKRSAKKRSPEPAFDCRITTIVRGSVRDTLGPRIPCLEIETLPPATRLKIETWATRPVAHPPKGLRLGSIS